jgi:hypothetical protein
MLSRKLAIHAAALLALGLLLPGCAAYHCMSLPDREQCYAAYDEYSACQASNRWLIRQVGVTWREECHTERYRCGKREKRCVEREREVCRMRSDPVYDYRDYNRGISQCMRQRGLAAYDDYFNRPLF